MRPQVKETIGSLRGARRALHEELVRMELTGATDEATLRRLDEAARGFMAQAHSVLVTMLYEAPGERSEEAEDLLSFFREVVGQIEAMLALNKRVS